MFSSAELRRVLADGLSYVTFCLGSSVALRCVVLRLGGFGSVMFCYVRLWQTS